MADNIVITQAYFANNKAAIDALNEFFAAAFKVKNFPFLDEESSIDKVLEKIISRLDAVDPTWLEDEGKLNGIIEMINEETAKLDPVEGIYQSIVDSNNTTLINAVDGYIGFKMLQMIADHFQDFGKLINGIYTFELFTKPSAYSDVMDIFSRPIEFSEIPDLDIEERIYSDDDYVSGVFSNDGITIPEELTPDTESERLKARQDLVGVEVFVDDAVQEAAEVNYFENTKPAHIKYSEKQKRYIISNEFNRVVDNLISGLRNCDTTDDLVKFFNTFKHNPNVFAEIVCPYILTNVFVNKKKYTGNPGTRILDYKKSYDSILSQNKGANRFKSYDLFSTFKTDKEGTIKFLEDFFKLNLVNKKDASIANNTLLNLFNIFDSRIYLDIIYNITPESARNGQNENQFVTSIRGNINKNSRTKTSYNSKENVEVPGTDDAKAVTEYVTNELSKFGEMSYTDLQYCEQYIDLVHQQIEGLGNKVYNAKISPFLLEEYIGESFYDIDNHMDDLFQEATTVSNMENFGNAVNVVMRDMKNIVNLKSKGQWNNNACLNFFKGEAVVNVKQAKKYSDRASRGLCGKLVESDVATCNELNTKLSNILKALKFMRANPIIRKNVKSAKQAIDIANEAKAIVGMESSFGFVKKPVVENTNTNTKKAKPDTTDENIEEAFVQDFDEFCIAMEAAPLNDGKIPSYMKNRIKMSDNIGASVVPEDIPDGIPRNPIGDLTDSIDTRADNGDSLDTMLGSGFDDSKLNKADAGKIVYNITNNYTNSFNQNSNNTTSTTTNTTTNDSSSGKTVTSTENVTNTNSHNNSNSGNDNSHDNRTDSSANKSNTHTNTKNTNTKNINKHDDSDHSTQTTTTGSNNNNNSNGSVDDSPTAKDGEQKLSSGKTVQEMFMFLESSEPHSLGSNATYPKEDTLTKAMDRDRESLPKQQEAKKGLTKVANTVKAGLKPIDRTKQWLTKVVDSFIKKDEDKVKASIIENTSYRSTIFKASRLALKLGITGAFWSLAPWMGIAYAGIQAMKLADRPRLKREVMREMEAELEVVEAKIQDLNQMHPETPEIRKEKYEYMRIKKKIEDYLLRAPHATIKNPTDTW